MSRKMLIGLLFAPALVVQGCGCDGDDVAPPPAIDLADDDTGDVLGDLGEPEDFVPFGEGAIVDDETDNPSAEPGDRAFDPDEWSRISATFDPTWRELGTDNGVRDSDYTGDPGHWDVLATEGTIGIVAGEIDGEVSLSVQFVHRTAEDILDTAFVLRWDGTSASAERAEASSAGNEVVDAQIVRYETGDEAVVALDVSGAAGEFVGVAIRVSDAPWETPPAAPLLYTNARFETEDLRAMGTALGVPTTF